MAENSFLAVDLGAESGRVIAGLFDGKKLRLEELHRFSDPGEAAANYVLLRLMGFPDVRVVLL